MNSTLPSIDVWGLAIGSLDRSHVANLSRLTEAEDRSVYSAAAWTGGNRSAIVIPSPPDEG